jgi:phosphate transport system permease protein
MTPLMHPRLEQRLVRAVLWTMTALTIAVLVFIVVFVLRKGLPALNLDFLLQNPSDMGKKGGIFSTIAATVAVTRIIRFGAECLAGIPSIIFGLFGFILFVTKLGFGWSILSGGLTLAFMVLPTIIRTSEEAIKGVPPVFRTVSFSLGGTKWQTVTRVVLPSALPGVMTGVILSVGRSIGETAAVIFTAGSALRLPNSLFSSSRTMSVHFYILAREGISTANAYGTAAVLIIAILAINILTYTLMNRLIRRYS